MPNRPFASLDGTERTVVEVAATAPNYNVLFSDLLLWIIANIGVGMQNNFTANVNPTINDDSGSGYSVGSIWFNKNYAQGGGSLWICQDATVGAANWQPQRNAVMFNGAPTVNDDDTLGYFANFLWFDLNTNTLYWNFTNTTGAAVWLAVGGGSGVQNNALAILDPTVNDDSGAGYSVSSWWFNTVTGTFWICKDATVAAAVWQEEKGIIGQIGSANGSGNLTATSLGVNYLQVSSGANNIINLITFNEFNGAEAQIFIIPQSGITVTVESSGNILLLNGASTITLDGTLREFICVQWDTVSSKWIQVYGKASGSGVPSLTDSHIFVGNAGNVATDVPMSGHVTIDNTGATIVDGFKVPNIRTLISFRA